MNYFKHLKQIIISEVRSVLKEVRADEYERLGIHYTATGKKALRVFDFDDTLAKTNSKVWVSEFDKETGEPLGDEYAITPAQYARFKTDIASKHPEKTYKYDYREFAQVVEPKIIKGPFEILKKVTEKIRQGSNIPAVILTARGSAANENIRKFLRSQGIDIPVKTLDGSAPELKSNWIKQAMLDLGITRVDFWDDSGLNYEAVRSLNEDPELIEKFGKGGFYVKSRQVTEKAED